MEENELMNIIRESLESHTVEEALKIKEEQDSVVEESFDVTWQNYNAVTTLRREILKNLSIVKFRMVFLKLLSSIVNYNALGELNYLSDRITESSLEIKEQKKLLELIHTTIVKLQSHDVIECNYDICELLSNIYDKDELLFNNLVKEMEISSAYIKGINVTYPDDSKKTLDELNKNIESSIMTLGLNQ